MDKDTAINWAIHHMVVDYYHKLLRSVRSDITIPGLRFDDFFPEAKERIEALMPTILERELPCQLEAKKILSWRCREQAEVAVMAAIQAFNRNQENTNG